MLALQGIVQRNIFPQPARSSWEEHKEENPQQGFPAAQQALPLVPLLGTTSLWMLQRMMQPPPCLALLAPWNINVLALSTTLTLEPSTQWVSGQIFPVFALHKPLQHSSPPADLNSRRISFVFHPSTSMLWTAASCMQDTWGYFFPSWFPLSENIVPVYFFSCRGKQNHHWNL